MMRKQLTTSPPVNSIWLAGDGRRMRVTGIIFTEHAAGGGWAELEVLPPYAPRQRRKTQMSFVEFGKFLIQETNHV